ncbi:MAG: DUF4276 family protein [Spirochaetales bacterium]
MHIEFLVEDSSGARAVENLIPRIIGQESMPHTWRIHKYKGVGTIPKGMSNATDAAKRILLDNLPRLLGGYDKTPGIDAVVVIVDTDRHDCRAFLQELQSLSALTTRRVRVLFRLAIEEVEAWYLSDQAAVLAAYPSAKRQVLNSYVPDSVCDTWETLADAVVVGGRAQVKADGWPRSGELKHEWAERITPLISIESNPSPSFQKFRNGLLRLVSGP